MSEITRYSEFKYDAGLYADDVDGDWCKYDDIAPIIQRNKEIETENSVQRLQIEHLEAELARLRGQKPSVYSYLQFISPSEGFDRWVSQYSAYPPYPSHDIKGIEPLYAEPNPAQIPDGWKLVPIEPTDEMLISGERERRSHVGNINPATTWKAMLSEAPDYKVEK